MKKYSTKLFCKFLCSFLFLFPLCYLNSQADKGLAENMHRMISGTSDDSLAIAYLDIAEFYTIRIPNSDSLDHYLEEAHAAAVKFQSYSEEIKSIRLKAISASKKKKDVEANVLFDSAYNIAILRKDTAELADVYYSSAVFSRQRGDKISFVNKTLEAIKLYDILESWNNKGRCLISLGIEYSSQKNLKKSLEKLEEASLLQPYLDDRINMYLLLNLGKVYRRKYQKENTSALLSKAMYYLEKGRKYADSTQENSFKGDFRLALLDTYVSHNPPTYRYDYADEVIKIGIETEDNFLIYQGHLGKAHMLAEEGKYKEILNLRKPMENHTKLLNNPIYYRSMHEINYHASKELGKYKDALYYLEQYNVLNDSLSNVDRIASYNEIVEKYESEKKEEEIDKLSTEKEKLLVSNQLKQSELKSQNYLILGIITISSLTFGLLYFYFKQIREKEKNKALEIEQKLLRAQMNPHFLFNSLNGIKRFYVEGKTDLANDFLADFSTFLRKVLERSDKTHIPVLEEIKFLSLYLDLECRRLSQKLEYHIDYDKSEFEFDDFLPSFIIQPIVENAVWHGLKDVEEKGRLNIKFYKVKDTIYCEVEDNGIGYFTSLRNKNETHKSKGLSLVEDRLGNKGSINILESIDNNGVVTGTKVIITYKNFEE